VGSDSSKRPHDPRLLLQVASSPCDKSTSKERDAEISYSPTYVPKSPRGAGKNRLGGGLASDIEDISDAEKEEPEPCGKEVEDDDADALNSTVLEARLKAFSKNYEKWSEKGSSRIPAGMLVPQVPSGATSVTSGPSGVSTPTGSATPSASGSIPSIPPPTNAVPVLAPLPLPTSSSVMSSALGESTATPVSVSGHQPPVYAGSSTPRINLDLKPTQPSSIVQRLLSRKSVFDEDSKRLESSSTTLDVAPPHQDELENNSKNMSVGSVNFSTGYNTISTLSDKASHLSSNSLSSSSSSKPCSTSSPSEEG
jgi:hypothetical protein